MHSAISVLMCFMCFAAEEQRNKIDIINFMKDCCDDFMENVVCLKYTLTAHLLKGSFLKYQKP